VMGQGGHTVRIDSDTESNKENPWDEILIHAPDENRPS
jgi:hypothetical protein